MGKLKPADCIVILRHLTLVTGVGLAFVIPVLLGWQLGVWLHAKVQWQGFLFCGLGIGILAGLYITFNLLKKTIPWE